MLMLLVLLKEGLLLDGVLSTLSTLPLRELLEQLEHEEEGMVA
jgi:hypothetical protein